jgi:hypothetical protein
MKGDALYELDFKDFDEKFMEFAVNKMPFEAEQGLFAAAGELKRDADTVEPKTPHLEGNLRGQYNITHKIDAGKIFAELTFKMPYAARWHEAEYNIDPVTGSKVNWSESGVGPKYVEAKLVRFMRKYIGIATDYIKAEMAKLGAAK